MLAVDTSTIIAYLSDSTGSDVEVLDDALSNRSIILPPVVLSELLSDPKLTESIASIFKQLPLLQVKKGFWERAGLTRAKLIAKKYKSRLADSLIAQSCIDYDIPLLTRDKDFRHYAKLCNLKLLTPS